VKQVVECLYIRETAPPKITVANDAACDAIEVVFETTNTVMNTPTLEKKVPGGTWTPMGTATEEQTGIPGTRRWYWSWPTWGEKNWGIEFRVQYRKPPMPGTLVTVGPETFTVTNTVVNGTQELLLWNGTDAVTAPWNIVHSPHRTPKFTVTVSIMPVGSDTAVKTYSLADQNAGGGSLSWQGETTAGGTAPPGVYTYTVCATHVAPGQTCTDTDKVTSVLEFGGTVAHDLTVPTLSLHTEASLRANQAAGDVLVQLYHDDTPKGLSDTDLGDLNGDPMVWWPIEFTDTIEHDDVGQYELVATGIQGAEAAQSNRSAAPKWLKPIATEFALWPEGYLCEGYDPTGHQDDFAGYIGSAFDAITAYQSPEGYHYPTVWRGPSADVLYEALGSYSIVFVVAHSLPNQMALTYEWDREQLRGGTAGEYPPHNDEVNDIYYIEELADGMDHCRFVFFHGCRTAVPNDEGSSLTGAAVDQGADLAAGFLERISPGPAAAMFHQRFWQYALGGFGGTKLTVRRAVAAALLDIRLEYGDDHMDGMDSIRLYPVDADEDLKDVEWGD